MEILKVRYETEMGERIGYFIRILKGYVPVSIISGVIEELDVIEEKPLELNQFSGEVK